MSIYTPPATNAVDFPLEAFTPADLTPATTALTVYTPPALTAVNFALTAYTAPTYPYVGWELLPSGVTGTLAATEAQDVALLAGALGHVGTLAATEAQDVALFAGTVVPITTITGTLAATEAQDVAAFAGTVTSANVPITGGVPFAWNNAKGLTPELRAKLRRMFEEAAQPVQEAIRAQAAQAQADTEEAEERALQAAILAARMEYHELYLRLLAYQREEMRQEEEAVAMTMILALSR